MKCPGCEVELLCDCRACVAIRDGEDVGRPLQITHPLYVECPLCGFTASKETWAVANPVPDHAPN